MNRSLVLSILSEDKPGIVETLAATISANGGNWLESRMTQLAGKFAGILQVSVSDADIQQLTQALQALETKGIAIITSEVNESDAGGDTKSMHFTLVGNDRVGIVKELSQAFANHHINVDELETGCSSMPWSGDPMFTARGSLQIPEGTDIDSLMDQLDDISDKLGVDIEIDEKENTTAEE
ncbi:MAG: glycine cleavage system protein R [Candidatus Pelagadaptatus aseana]|uniref:glycine cleavage system protein R n=1 Tax=Candidatus Pelagadaptatus aseana TaxID=3120508 RepID=UPI0039B1CE25